MLEKLAFVEKNVLFYSRLSSEYHPLHHIHNFSSHWVIFYRILPESQSNYSFAVSFSPVRPFVAFILF